MPAEEIVNSVALKKEQKKFAKLYAKSEDHIESYLKVFPKVDRKTAATNGKRWLNKAEVAAEIQRLKTPLQDFPENVEETQQKNTEIPPHLRPLEPKEQRFCEEYLLDLNAAQATIRAGYRETNSRCQGSELLAKPNVRHFIRKLMAERAQRTQITVDWVLQKLAIIAEAKITDFARVEMREVVAQDKPAPKKRRGNITDVQETEQETEKDAVTYYKAIDILETDLMPQHLLGAIASLKQTANGMEIKLHDPNKALELIGRHLAMWNDKLTLDANEELSNLFKSVMNAGN